VRAKRLGRGLSNLLNRTDEADPLSERRARVSAPTNGGSDGGVREIPIAAIRSNPFQPRSTFGAEGLEELSASIEEHGVLQPVVVRRALDDDVFELVAGERRLRAAQSLGLEAIPAVVRVASDEEMQTLALVENLQREDLNAMEKARALKGMMRNFGLTQDDVARRVGKARTTVANLLRLLDLPQQIQELVEVGALSGAHARAILQAQGTQRRLDLARLAVEQGLSVRELERRARAGPTVGKRRSRPENPYVRDLETRLQRALATEVRLRVQGKGGRIEVRYHDPDELDRLLELLGA
jgi:ParB family chromosome partitioning protein